MPKSKVSTQSVQAGTTNHSDERPANLEFWFADGQLSGFDARVAADVEVSIGRADSKRALGFQITKGGKTLDFVLDRDQVAALAAYLRFNALGRLKKPLGRMRNQFSPLVALNDPKVRLHMRLLEAAMDMHPGWHRLSKDAYTADAGAPDGAKLVAWFKKTHPAKAARVEQKFVKEDLWKA